MGFPLFDIISASLKGCKALARREDGYFLARAKAHYTLSEGEARGGKSDCTAQFDSLPRKARYTLSEGGARGRKGGLIIAIAQRCKNGGFSVD